MKTNWGSHNRETRHLWFGTELMEEHPDCLEHIIVHEIAHYFERSHHERSTTLVGQHMPSWRSRREQLNEAPLTHESSKKSTLSSTRMRRPTENAKIKAASKHFDRIGGGDYAVSAPYDWRV